jgi:predicted ATPase/class 3 adenylate cyclase
MKDAVALPVDASLDGERRTVTVLRADVQGSAELLARVGAEDWAVTMSRVLRALGAEVVRFGGDVDRHGEDGLVACFGATTAHEDDPERAVLSALAMQEGFGARLAELSEREGYSGLAENLGLLVVVHTGQVVVTAAEEGGPGQSTAMGEALAFTARVQTNAKLGEVWVSEATRRLVELLFEWEPRGEISPGSSGKTVRVYCALGRSTLTDKMRGIAGLSSPLIGRDAELRALEAAIERLRSGVGGIATLVGEAGIGKSRLVAECRRGVTPPLQWIEGRCLSYATSVAYQMWGGALRGLLGLDPDAPPEAAAETLRERVHELCAGGADEVHPFLARLMSLPLTASAEARLRGIEGEGLQVLTFGGVETLIECVAQREPLVLACEDLHWADPTSLALLEHLLPLTDRVPLLVICVFRPVEDHGCWRIKETADRLYGHRHTELWLGPLSADESAQLVGSLLYIEDLPDALRSRILDRAEGNPFYVEEILRSLIDEGAIAYDERGGRWQAVREVSELALPDTLRGVLVARIDRLPRGARQVLQLASVVGRIFSHRVLAPICSPRPTEGEDSATRQRVEGALDAQLVALQRAQMVRERSRMPEATYIFKHQLTLDAAYESLLRRKRRVLHRRVAEVLEQLFPERVEEQPGLLAHHWERAGEVKRAIPHLRRAGERAAAQFANAEAVAYFSRALELVPADAAQQTPERRSECYGLLLVRERVYELQRDREAQGRDLATLEGLAEALGDRAKQAEVAVRRARYCTRIRELGRAISAARTAVRLAQEVHDAGREAMGYLEWGRALSSQGKHKAARPHLERALALVRDARLRQIEAEVLHILGGVLHYLGDGERGMECYERALGICRQIGDRRGESDALHDVGWALLFHVNWTESEEYLRRALKVSREMGNRGSEAWAILNLGIISYFRGDYVRSRNDHEQSLRICREVRERFYEAEVLYGLGRIAADLVDCATARDYFEQSLRVHRGIHSGGPEGWVLVRLGLVFHLQGDHASAGRYYEQALRIGREVGNWQVEAMALMHMGLLSHHLGDDRAARACSQQALGVIGNLDLGWAVDLIHVFDVLGHALAGLGRPAEAADAYRQALALRRERGQHHLTMESLAGLAHVALAQGDPAGALAHVKEILDYLEDHPVLEGTWEPLRIYLTCYRVLQDGGDPRAGEILDAAYHLLQERAATIEEEELRRSYLENVAAHREIVAAWKETSHP